MFKLLIQKLIFSLKKLFTKASAQGVSCHNPPPFVLYSKGYELFYAIV